MGNDIKQADVMPGNKPGRKSYGYLCPGPTTQPGDMQRAAAKAGGEDKPPDDTYSHMHEAGLFILVSSRALAKGAYPLPVLYQEPGRRTVSHRKRWREGRL